MKKLKILYIAGVSPYHFANMIYDCMLALEKDGHEVDFITLYEFRQNSIYRRIFEFDGKYV